MIFLPRCDACEYEEDVWDVRTREEELAALMKSRPCRDVAFMHHLLMTGWETELGFRVDIALVSRTGRFHPRHYLVLVLKWLLITTWGRQEGWRHRSLLSLSLLLASNALEKLTSTPLQGSH